MTNLYMTIGMIGSGKSTWAKKFVKDHPNTKIVSGDDLREMFAGYYLYDEKFESTLANIIDSIAIELIYDGYDVILDECHLTQLNRYSIIKTIKEETFDVRTTAVIFPLNRKAWHLTNRYKNLRGYTKELWSEVFDKHDLIFDKFDKTEETYFDKVILIGS